MEIVTDEAVKHSLWGNWMLSHFPKGVEDPEYCVLKFTPKSATYWIDSAFVKDEKYIKDGQNEMTKIKRKGARRIKEIPADILEQVTQKETKYIIKKALRTFEKNFNKT